MSFQPSALWRSRVSAMAAGLVYFLGASAVAGAESAAAWKQYNAALEAYRSGDFAKADEAWQVLSTAELPDAIRGKVWFQSGNAAFRIGERTVKGEPENALREWMRAREAFRVAASKGPVQAEAKSNLDLVERNLVRLNLDLAARLEASSRNQPIDKTVELLQAATVYAHQATDIAPENAEAKQTVTRTEKGLREALQKKGRELEKKADEALKRGNQWDRTQAKQNLDGALSDFEAGLTLAPRDGTLNLDRQRVAEKLARLHIDNGNAEKKRGDQSAKWEPDEAENHYREALAEFDQSLGVKPNNNSEAERGREEVLKALELLQLREADRLAKQGREDIPRATERAAEQLTEAVERYEEAMELNPDNAQTPPKLAATKKDLAPVMEKLGQLEQRRAQEAEKRSPQEAVQHLEKAETAFDRAQQADPSSESAQQAAGEVQKELDRLRQKLAAQAQGKAGEQGQKDTDAKEAKAGKELAEMMEELKREQAQQMDPGRRRQERFSAQPPRTTRHW